MDEGKENEFRLNPKYASAATIQLANSACAAGKAYRQISGFDDGTTYKPSMIEGAFGFLLGYASAILEVEHERRVRETLHNARPAKGYGELV